MNYINRVAKNVLPLSVLQTLPEAFAEWKSITYGRPRVGLRRVRALRARVAALAISGYLTSTRTSGS